MPTPKPSSSASAPGRPCSVPSLAITIDDRTMIAPTDRSMPAVRITSVWAMPRVPTTITCWTTSERFAGSRKRSVVAAKYTTASSRTNSGPSVALRCRTSWMRVPSVASRAGPTTSAVPPPPAPAGASFLKRLVMV